MTTPHSICRYDRTVCVLWRIDTASRGGTFAFLEPAPLTHTPFPQLRDAPTAQRPVREMEHANTLPYTYPRPPCMAVVACLQVATAQCNYEALH